MDKRCNEILETYVRSTNIIRCLELTGYTTSDVMQGLNNADIDDIEVFVRDMCMHMEPQNRATYVGALFAQLPQHFKIPNGTRKGILLAVSRMLAANKTTEDKSIQTEPQSLNCTNSINFSDVEQFYKSLSDFNRQSLSVSNGQNCQTDFYPIHNLSMIPSTSGTEIINVDNDDSFNMSNNHRFIRRRSTINYRGSNTIDLEKIKATATMSVIRVTARQFADTVLVEGKDFTIDLEIVAKEGSERKVSGIYCCLLCLAKRGEPSAVRFSVVKNRHPIVSNIMSHLRIHFQPRSSKSGELQISQDGYENFTSTSAVELETQSSLEWIQ